MNPPLFASDRVAITSRTVTDEGFLIAPGTLARTGIQAYRAGELGIGDGDPMRLLRLYRPPEEVFAAQSMHSFEGKPITLDHPPKAVTADNWNQYAKGEVRNVARAGERMTATLVIRAKDAIDAVQGGKSELSNGYLFELDATPGVTPQGEAFDGIQRNIRGNHIALVDAARCGPACRVSDSSTHPPKGIDTMPNDALRKVAVDGIPVEVCETAAAAIDKLLRERDEVRTALKSAPTHTVIDALANEVKALKEAAIAKDKEIDALKKDVLTPAARDAMVFEWARLIEDGKRLYPALLADGKTCHAIRQEVIGNVKEEALQAVVNAIIGDQRIADLDEVVARTAFAALAALKPQAASDGATVQALLGMDSSSGKAVDARSLWAANLNHVKE